jgi:hypothetical protein
MRQHDGFVNYMTSGSIELLQRMIDFNFIQPVIQAVRMIVMVSVMDEGHSVLKVKTHLTGVLNQLLVFYCENVQRK